MDDLDIKSRPVFSWYPILFHGIVASVIAWTSVLTMENNPAIADVVKPFLLKTSFIIPSIAGYAAISPNLIWAKIYLLVCWLGAPFYISFFWRLSSYVLPDWVATQKAFHFWLITLGNLSFIAGTLFFPNQHSLPSDATHSIRVAAGVVSLMKESYTVFSIMGIVIIMTFSFMLAVSLKSIQIRLTTKTGELNG